MGDGRNLGKKYAGLRNGRCYFSGTSNKASKNIAEVSVSVDNENHDGPAQYKDLDEVEVRRKIEKDKGSKFYINDKEVRARDAQMFFADLIYWCTLSINDKSRTYRCISYSKTYRSKSNIRGSSKYFWLHVRRHEAELRLNAAETNLKRADELRRQQEKQLANLQKQAEEATKYKLFLKKLKKLKLVLYYLKLLEIDKEIKIENEINTEAEGEVSNFNQQISEFEKL